MGRQRIQAERRFRHLRLSSTVTKRLTITMFRECHAVKGTVAKRTHMLDPGRKRLYLNHSSAKMLAA